jgi:hypothetical protein
MQTISYAATRWGYSVQVVDQSRIVYEYSAGNHQNESTAVVNPRSPNAVKLRQLKRWARQTAGQIARERGIPPKQIAHDPDLEAQLKEEDAGRKKV